MEVQINVAKGNGEIVQGSYHGRNWHGYTDGLTTWKDFRIPWNPKDNPYYKDKPITFDISKHAEFIGMTGWDWKNKCSRWVAFDFDSIVNHKQGLTNEELEKIRRRLSDVQYVNMVSSTSGNGFHIYVFLFVQGVANHTEHAAVARCILAKISTEIRYNLESNVDTCGSNIWVWARHAIPGKSFKTIKEGTSLQDVPANWRDFLEPIIPRTATDQDMLVAAQNELILDDEHLRLLEWFQNDSGLSWYNNDRQMLVCHTADLNRVYQSLRLVGLFDTIAEGKNHGRDQNCFCFPLSQGQWIVRRHSRGCQESSLWFTDSSGWTSCYFNRLPNLKTASTAMGGIETEKDYNFKHLSEAIASLVAMGIPAEIPTMCNNRPTTIKQTGDKLIVSFKHEEGDNVNGWAKKKNNWHRVFFHNAISDIEIPDNLIRHVIADGTDLGWYLYTNNGWVFEAKHNIINALSALGHKKPQIDIMLGKCVDRNWLQVNKPFKSEYPGKRQWNRKAPQFRFMPKQGKHPHWDKILEHCGAGLNPKEDEWCHEHGIFSGTIYLQLWISSLFQYPSQPLPYLVFYGEQNTGKSIFHESLALLFTGGYVRADHALTNPSGFNGELLNAVLCVVEETDLSRRGYANDRIKDWVTGMELSIHAKGKTPFNISNCTHWVQCTNDASYVPILPGDTRIVLASVGTLQSEIPKNMLIEACIQEAPAFLHTLIERELPETRGRLRIPVLATTSKGQQIRLNIDVVTEFIKENCYQVLGGKELFSVFYTKFTEWLDPVEKSQWSKRRLSKQLVTLRIASGRYGGRGDMYIGNISFIEDEDGKELIESNGRLV